MKYEESFQFSKDHHFFLFFLPGLLKAQLFMTQEEAIEYVSSDSLKLVRRTLFLDSEQAERIEKNARIKLESKIITYYSGAIAGQPPIFVFFERNKVRTKDEVFMVVLNADATVRLIKMLAFYEPPDYIPRAVSF